MSKDKDKGKNKGKGKGKGKDKCKGKSNVDRLIEAKLLTCKDDLPKKFTKQINDLSAKEVDSLIAVKQSLGLTGEINLGIQFSAY